jgi:ADP-ribosylglycohydrolase
MNTPITKPYLTEAIKSALLGVAVGDALGVPAEFRQREFLKENPVTDMTGHGTHHQPPGTFSDDSSLTFCLVEALAEGFDLHTIARNFVRWRDEGFWTAHGFVFDIGGTTGQAIGRLRKGVQPDLAGDSDENCNGNGSLMRILPLLFHLHDKPAGERFDLTRQVSSITHRYIRSVIACFYYLEYARLLLQGSGKREAYDTLRKEIPAFLNSLNVPLAEIARFDRLLKGNIAELPEDAISGSGYVLHTLEASLWCLLTTGSYREAVLKAVNLGNDTDTTAAVTGGLAGLFYGWNTIPDHWVLQLARRDDIEDLAERMAARISR